MMGETERSFRVIDTPSSDELDYDTLQGGVWEHLRGIHPEKTVESRALIADAWNIKLLIQQSGDNVLFDDALDRYLMERPELESLMSAGIPGYGNKSALKLLTEEVAAERKDPGSAKVPHIRQAAA